MNSPPRNANAPLAKGRREKLLGPGQSNSVSGFTQASAALAERPPFSPPPFLASDLSLLALLLSLLGRELEEG
jgi:hypothetical protein